MNFLQRVELTRDVVMRRAAAREHDHETGIQIATVVPDAGVAKRDRDDLQCSSMLARASMTERGSGATPSNTSLP
jgi:hypothetical protein